MAARQRIDHQAFLGSLYFALRGGSIPGTWASFDRNRIAPARGADADSDLSAIPGLQVENRATG
ncbi:MAG TPA: hypothetical protein VIL46_16455 [Gemmataceae bacterium]